MCSVSGLFEKEVQKESFLKNSDIVSEESAFVTQAIWCVPERELESENGSGVIIGHFFGTKESHHPEQWFEFPVGHVQNACYLVLSSQMPCACDQPLLREGILRGVLMKGSLDWMGSACLDTGITVYPDKGTRYNPGADCACLAVSL